ncbi:MAG: DapH/DapD/GlmU-related protein [Bacillota bacterium]|nr:DapH/DapD/GlmU-related protein [Bacillota bacterium]
MKKVLYFISLFLYYIILRKLPTYDSPGGKLWKHLRASVCKNLFLSCGKDVNIEQGAYFGRGNEITIGDRSGLGKQCKVYGKINVGNDVVMGPDVIIYTKDHVFSDTKVPINRQGMTEMRPVNIEDDVYIGARVIILPGINIGKGSVIAAGTIVTKDVPEFAIFAGNPGKVIKFRNKDNKNET